ncbi:MAG: acetate kinase [Epsilonproteobacteria bacterium]|nr:MAG: acetate kinase [Campylobacterota bacterium]
MNILVINSGSSSIKCQYFIKQKSVASLFVERIGEKESYSKMNYQDKVFDTRQAIANHSQALETIFSFLKKSNVLSSIDELVAIGHRVVHGGSHFSEATLITTEIIETIRSLSPLAPLHNPANLNGIEIIRKKYPHLPQVAVFDTAFHQTMPQHATLYPIPYRLYEQVGIQRYGFHGTSHAYVAKEAAKMIGKDITTLNLITLHLGNGASATAIQSGKSIDTSMGMTPLEGLMMGTRCGDIDPAIIPFLSSNHNMSTESIDKMLNKESGLKGICGTNDMREVITQAKEDKLSLLALEMYTHRIKKYIGAYTALLGRVDAIIFTGGIGEHASKVRTMVCEGLEESIGLIMDSDKNQKDNIANCSISHKKSKINVYIISTNEELEIVIQTEKVLKNKGF